MPCKNALITKAVTLKPDQTVEQGLASLKKSGASFAPVLDDDGTVAGVFSLPRLLENTLPVSVAVAGGGSVMNVTIPAAPGMVKRLQKYRLSKISELMQRPARVFHPDTALDAAVNHVRQEGEPAIVVHPETGAFTGIVTDSSILEALEKGF